jgi:hypothetical protein
MMGFDTAHKDRLLRLHRCSALHQPCIHWGATRSCHTFPGSSSVWPTRLAHFAHGQHTHAHSQTLALADLALSRFYPRAGGCLGRRLVLSRSLKSCLLVKHNLHSLYRLCLKRINLSLPVRSIVVRFQWFPAFLFGAAKTCNLG